MRLILGGSPSTGSSLLRQMINRHPQIYCGPETRLFCYPKLFTAWSSTASRLLNGRPLTAPDVHLVRGVNLVGEEQCWSAGDLDKLVRAHKSLSDFAEGYFSRPLEQYGATFWAEKTPTNVVSFMHFAEVFDDAHVVHIVRNPLDVIASLVSRGHTVFHAVSRYLFNTACGLRARGLVGYHEVVYEELVTDPEGTLVGLLEPLGIPFHQSMIGEGNPHMSEAATMEGWLHKETDAPAASAIGRFAKLEGHLQDSILGAVKAIRLNEPFATEEGLQHVNIAAIARELSYEIPEGVVDGALRGALIKQQQQYVAQSAFKMHLFPIRRRPIAID